MERVSYTMSDIIEQSVFLVLKAMKGKNTPKELFPYFTLSFAGFYLYYGSDYINTIYSVYRDSQFFITEGESYANTQFIYSKNQLTLQEVESSISDQIAIHLDSDPNLMFRDVVHEINHLINSKRNRVFDELDQEKGMFLRNGLMVKNLDSRKIQNYYANEVVNSEESDDIVRGLFYTIPDAFSIRQKEIQKLMLELDPYRMEEIASYQELREKTQPMVKNLKFYQPLKKIMIEGNFDHLNLLCQMTSQSITSFSELSSHIDRLGEKCYSKKR